MATTKLSNLIDPEVMSDMVSAALPEKIVVTPFAALDTTLTGNPGSTISVPSYKYIGDAEDLAEGVTATAAVLGTSVTKATIKKAVKAVEITDEAKLCGYGDPEGEIVKQLAKAIASKVDSDAMEAITTKTADGGEDGGVQLYYDGSTKAINYAGIVDAIDVFAEEFNSEKVLFINPAQLTALRKDADFISADKYGTGKSVMVTGEVGMVANCHIVPTKRVKKITTGGATGSASVYRCPVIKLNGDGETDTDAPAVTIFVKRDVNVEPSRDVLAKKDIYSADEHYTVALTNASRALIADFKA